jgi:hypothetical protein
MIARLFLVPALFLAVATATASAQEGPFKAEALAESAPDAIPAAIRDQIQEKGFRVLDSAGEPYVDVWLRKSIPAAKKPSGPKGDILFPSLAEGELLGAMRYHVDAGDYRDQTIPTGVYTVRYGLRRVDGNHQGVSLYRDFALLLPPALDTTTAPLEVPKLEKTSADVAGTRHPSNLMMLAPAADTQPGSVRHDEQHETWGLNLSLPLAVEGEAAPVSLPIELIVFGYAPA